MISSAALYFRFLIFIPFVLICAALPAAAQPFRAEGRLKSMEGEGYLVVKGWPSGAGQLYNLYMTDTSGKGYSKIVDQPIHQPTALIRGLKPGKRYYFVLTFLKTEGGKLAESRPSQEFFMSALSGAPPPPEAGPQVTPIPPKDDFEAGMAYEKGSGGLARDDAKALEHYRRAALDKHSGGQFSLGVFHDQGLGGLPRNRATALRWYRLAALQGHSGGQYEMGRAFEFGSGVKKDLAEAAYYYRVSAGQGHHGAMYSMGMCHENGTGLEKDLTQALEWYEKAAAHGHPYAPTKIKQLRRQHGL